jgi:hypothetical protein
MAAGQGPAVIRAVHLPTVRTELSAGPTWATLAVKVTRVSTATRPVLMVILCCVAPAGTAELLMLFATKALSLLMLTTMPVRGAGALNVSVKAFAAPLTP